MYNEKDKKSMMVSDDDRHGAKMEVLEELREAMRALMGEKMGKMKEVSVAAPDSEHLKKGLDMASEMVERSEEPEEEMMEDISPEMASEEDPEDLDRQIAELMAKKAKLMKA